MKNIIITGSTGMVDAAVTGRGQETMENKDIMAYGRKRRAKK